MPGAINNMSENRIARITGIAWLMIIVAGIFAEFIVRESLIVSGNAAETAANIIESEALFRVGVIGDLMMIAFDVTVAALLFVLLRSVSPALARLTAWFRLIQAAIIGASLLSLFAALQLLTNAEFVVGTSTQQLNSLAMAFMEVHSVGYDVSLVFFSLSIAVLSYLLYTSKLVPVVLSVLLAAASVVYMTGSMIHILAPESVDSFAAAYAVTLVAELALALWFIFKGVRMSAASRLEAKASAPSAA